MGDVDSLVERALQASAGGIQMSTTIIELFCHLITGEVVDGAQTDPDDVILFCILAQRHG